MSLYSKEDIQCYRHQALELSRDKLDNSVLSKRWKNATLTAHTHTQKTLKKQQHQTECIFEKTVYISIEPDFSRICLNTNIQSVRTRLTF